MSKYILASKSPRRKEILSLLNIDFEIMPADIDEQIDFNNDLRKEIEKLAYLKANYIFKNHEDKIVIGSDTIVVIDNKVLGKPKDEIDAFNMLKKLSGNVHEVITGVCVISKEHIDNYSSVSKVYFKDMSDEEIRNYIKTKEPLDKAGAYGIQGIGGRFIEKIDGDFYSIMGLPLNMIYDSIKRYE